MLAPGKYCATQTGSPGPRFLVVVAAVLVGFLPMPAAPVTARDSKIVEVIVYPDRAEIVREAKLDLPAGASTVEFEGLPWQIEADSLRASATGVPATLGAVEIRDKVEKPQEPADLAVAREDVTRLEGQLATLAQQDDVDKDLREYLNGVRMTTAQRESQNLSLGKSDPIAIQGVFGLLQSRLQELGAAKLARQTARERLTKDLSVARAKAAAARPAGEIHTKLTAVEVEARRAGLLSLRLAYLVPGASWRPSYRAALDAATGEINLASEAVVLNATGEDWDGVSLRVSTAAPAQGVAPPRLASWVLPLPRAASAMAVARGGFNSNYVLGGNAGGEAAGVVGGVVGGVLGGVPGDGTDPMTGTFAANINPDAIEDVVASQYQNQLTLAPGINDKHAAAEQAVSAVVHSTYNVLFEVPGPSTVPSDRSEHKLVLRQETLAGKLEYRASPMRHTAAYLVAKTNAPEDYPLLAGPVRVFTGGAFVGAAPLPETGPKAELAIPFGVDNRIKVEGSWQPRSRAIQGFAGREKKFDFAHRTTVENLRDRKVTVIVEGQVPVSEDARVKVERSEKTTGGFREDPERPGVLEWTLALNPGEKQEIVVGFSIRYPKDLVVPAIE